MQDPKELLSALRDAMPRVRTHAKRVAERHQEYQTAWNGVAAKTYDELVAELTAANAAHTGAKPTEDLRNGLVQSCAPNMVTKDELLAFAKTQLRSREACFVDGSELSDTQSTSFPYAAVNFVGVFLPCEGDRVESSQAKFIDPAELEHKAHLAANPSHIVSYERWCLEVNYISKQMRDHPNVLAVMDGSLINSFATRQGSLRDLYDEKMCHLLDLSKSSKSPIVAYIDTSRARDLVAMTNTLNKGLPEVPISDVDLLKPLFKHLGSRLALFQVDRHDDATKNYEGHEVLFTYALLGPGVPCRLEFPDWVTPEEVDDIVRYLLAQCLAHNGYPRSISECHDACSITRNEREHFAITVESALRAEGINVIKDRKQRSKEFIRLKPGNRP